MSTLKYIADGNLQTVTLVSDYTAADGHMHLTGGHGARLPTAGDFWIANTSGTYRCFKVTARAVDDITVTPAQDGTADGNIGAGAELKWALGLAGFDQFRQDICGGGAFASLPMAEKSGKLYLPTDGEYIHRDTGTAFGAWGPIWPLTLPVLGDFTWVNQGAATASATNGGIYLFGPKTAGTQGRLLKKVAPSPPYTITAYIKSLVPNAAYAQYGPLFRQDSNGYVHKWCVYVPSTGAQKWASQKATSLTGGATNYVDAVPYHQPYQLEWFRIADDGANRILSYSVDGYNWITFHTIGRTDFLTADEVGFYVDAGQANYDIAMLLLHWKEE